MRYMLVVSCFVAAVLVQVSPMLSGYAGWATAMLYIVAIWYLWKISSRSAAAAKSMVLERLLLWLMLIAHFFIVRSGWRWG